MQLTLKYINRTLELLTQLVDDLDIEALNKVPTGFNNNIAWNFGHAVVTIPALCYLRSGIKPGLVVPYFQRFAKGSKPTDTVTREELDELKALSISLVKQVEDDITAGVFVNIKPFATSTFAYDMDTIDEILTAVLAHTGLHYGYSLALKKALL